MKTWTCTFPREICNFMKRRAFNQVNMGTWGKSCWWNLAKLYLKKTPKKEEKSCLFKRTWVELGLSQGTMFRVYFLWNNMFFYGTWAHCLRQPCSPREICSMEQKGPSSLFWAHLPWGTLFFSGNPWSFPNNDYPS